MHGIDDTDQMTSCEAQCAIVTQLGHMHTRTHTHTHAAVRRIVEDDSCLQTVGKEHVRCRSARKLYAIEAMNEGRRITARIQ